MKRFLLAVWVVVFIVLFYLGMTYYRDNLGKIALIQRQQIAAIGREIRQGAQSNQLRVIMLFLAYGALHSLGPGHGKSIISGIFLTEKKSLSRLLLFSATISYLQGLMAFVMVRIFSLIGRNLLPQEAFKTEEGLRLISAAFILILGAFMLYRSLRVGHSHSRCGTSKTSYGAVVLLGLTPCFGTVNLLLFLGALGLGSFQFIGALAVATGMFITVVVFGGLTVSLKSAGSTVGGGLVIRIIEVAGPVIMMAYSFNILRQGLHSL